MRDANERLRAECYICLKSSFGGWIKGERISLYLEGEGILAALFGDFGKQFE